MVSFEKAGVDALYSFFREIFEKVERTNFNYTYLPLFNLKL